MNIFIMGLVISGVTAFPLLSELNILANIVNGDSLHISNGYTGLTPWILTVRHGLEHTYAKYPWIAYGTDWLAFGHIVIAGFFVGPLINPVASRSTIYTGIVACLGVIPLGDDLRSDPGYPLLLATDRLLFWCPWDFPVALLSQDARTD